MRRRTARLLLLLLLLPATIACSQGSTGSSAGGETTGRSPTPTTIALTPPAGGLAEARVTEVIDGDTLKAAVNSLRYQFFDQVDRVRLIGMNTPELNPPDGPVECYAREAAAETQRLIDQVNGRVWLERDISDRDRYGRLLRFVWLDTPSGWVLLDLELVRLGYARAGNYPPDIRYQAALFAAERDARQQGRGLWGACR